MPLSPRDTSSLAAAKKALRRLLKSTPKDEDTTTDRFNLERFIRWVSERKRGPRKP